MPAHTDVLTHLPLSEATYFILLSLSPQPRHGYAIMKDTQTLSDQRLVLSTSTLYTALKRLLALGWIQRVPDPQADGMARGRKAYSLTRLGRRVLEAEIARLEGLVAAAQLHTREEQV